MGATMLTVVSILVLMEVSLRHSVGASGPSSLSSFNPCFNGSISETAIILKSIENSHSNIILEMPIFVENHISFVLKMSIFPNFYIKPCGENH